MYQLCTLLYSWFTEHCSQYTINGGDVNTYIGGVIHLLYANNATFAFHTVVRRQYSGKVDVLTNMSC